MAARSGRMNSAGCYVYKAEMGFTHVELLRGLPSAIEPYVLDRSSDSSYSMSHENRVAILHLGPERVRKIASIKLPVTNVTIEFRNFSEIQHTEFLDRFKRYLHRGGG